MSDRRMSLVAPILAMSVVVVASNILVKYPVNDWLTWGAFTFPLAFLITDLSNRAFGPYRAAKVVGVGFVVGILMSAFLADWMPFMGPPNVLSEIAVNTAIASGLAFLAGQLLDIAIFQRLRKGVWWRAPLVSSAVASAADTVIFFYLFFAVFFPYFVPEGSSWYQLGIGDYGIKAAMALALLFPYRLLMGIFAPHLLSNSVKT
ncbi:MAG: queuosine precursor transporter [Alphaproteobacteria bacterium]|jgi:queuosine precursor transporter|nr:queuosine precursor transporter [Rhodospirillaceae bacterium]MBT6512854.1 queuosine precursor transporter [Rhodospirillaceae bacterium]MBT7612890.1 queuosine precursor transporter [Rhodospirillaceae bacterium]MBT7648571.1 queuosine precursor transporter [Rhodospirillaceae bacterium]MDG2480290.1 queuosine precursor transporter [Alphaproteobacteria bacterium]